MIRALFAAAAMFVAAASFALSPEAEAWGKSGVQWLFTEEEAAAWKNVKTEDEARAFILLFWARRDPTPTTPANELRERIEQRIAYADANFTALRTKTKGSLTERGMMWIVFGKPHRLANTDAVQQQGNSGRARSIGMGGNALNRFNSSQVWLYQGDDARKLFGVPRAEFKFIDYSNNGEYHLERIGSTDVAAWRRKVIASHIKQPELTKAPEYGGGGSMAAPVVTALTTPALASVIAEVKAATANPYANAAFAAWGEFITASGEYFVPVSLYVPKTSPAASAQSATFFGVIEDAEGKSVLAFEEPATLSASKNDFYVEKSLTALPAGKYRGWFGLAAGSRTLAVAPVEMQLAGALDKTAAAVSPLILSNNVYAMDAAQKPMDPFAFGGTKVVPKADKAFSVAGDELWYFFELRNPGVEAETSAANVQVKVEITGKTESGTAVKKTAPLSKAEMTELKGVPGHFAHGNAFPLTNFKPGWYTITVKVIDTVTKSAYTLSDHFRVIE
jgi:GWxTD domain-containing protein